MRQIRVFLSFLFFSFTALWSQECGQAAPKDTDFKQRVLYTSTDYIMEVAPARDGKIFFAEKLGWIKVYDPITTNVTDLIKLNVYNISQPATVKSAGLNGIALDPNFEQNGYLYVYYMEFITSDEHKVQHKKTPAHLARFTYKNNAILPGSEKRLITNMLDNLDHQSGSITFDPAGNLYLATGDDTHAGGYGQYAPLDWSGSADDNCNTVSIHGGNNSPCSRDASRSTANTNDLRGKVIRITPQENGTYTIPDGNLFPQTDSTRGEIYTMGHRVPYRISIDKKRNWLLIGEGGPANRGGGKRGPTGHEEFNIAKGPAFFGWPFIHANNKGFRPWTFVEGNNNGTQGSVDVTVNGGEPWDVNKPILNLSPRNTGKILLPAPIAPVMYFDKGSSSISHEYFRGYRGCVPIAGPVYYYGNYDGKGKQLPPYYNGKWLISDVTPGAIGVSIATLDADGKVTAIEKMPVPHKGQTLDLELGYDGALYYLSSKKLGVYEWAGCSLPVVSIQNKPKQGLGFFNGTSLSNANRKKSFDIFNLSGTLVGSHNHETGLLKFNSNSQAMKNQILFVHYK